MVYLTPRSSRCDSPVAPYPGHDLNGTYRSPSPQPRVKPEGEPYYIKNKGTLGKWVFNPRREAYTSPRPVPRCPTRASLDNYTLGRHGTIKRLLDGSATARPETAPPRIKSEGEPIASISRGKRMKVIVNKYGESGPTPRAPRIKPEAEEHSEKHKGGRMNRLVHSYGKQPESTRPGPRVKQEGAEIAEISKGKRMDRILQSGKYGRQPLSARNAPRVKPEGEDNAELDKGKRMTRLVHSYGRMPLSSRAVPRVKVEGDPNYRLDMGRRMCMLIHDVKKYPSTPCMAPRIRTSEGDAILRKSRGQMGKVLRQQGQRTCIYKPGIQQKSYLKTQMM